MRLNHLKQALEVEKEYEDYLRRLYSGKTTGNTAFRNQLCDDDYINLGGGGYWDRHLRKPQRPAVSVDDDVPTYKPEKVLL